MGSEWLAIAKEALKIPGLLVEIYGDLAKPGVKQVGIALEAVIGLGNTILWPLIWANKRARMYLDRNLELYRLQLLKVPQDKVVAVTPEIGVPILERLSYVSDPNLSTLYITLLTKASSSDNVSKAHPSFVNVINNLCPDEALLLKKFASGKDIPFSSARWVSASNHSYSIAADMLVEADILSQLQFPQNIPAYISNLAGLGIVQVIRGERIANTETYTQIEESWTSQFSEGTLHEPDDKLKFIKSIIELTEFGKLFIGACSDEKRDSLAEMK